MKITFLENHVSVLSGNSYYDAGEQADLRRGQELIDQGIAYAGWGSPPTPLQGPVSTLDSMSHDDLRALAKERGIVGYARMKFETLIERLTDGNQ